MDSQEAPTNKEASSSGGGDQKKAKTSPSPPASHDHQDGGDDALPPPPPLNTLHLCSLPDIAHAAIACYLTMVGMHCMMESSSWLLEAYGGRVKELRLVHTTDKGPIPPTPTLLSIMSRRPNVISIAATEPTMSVMVEAMRKGYLNKLQALEIVTLYSDKDKAALCGALADGVCPKINKLVLPDLLHGLEWSLGAVLRSRMEEGKDCCGLKSLEIKGQGHESSLSPLLSSGACEALEELKIKVFPSRAEEGLSEWLLRTKAPHLRYLHRPKIALRTTIAALCSPGVAPLLQVLDLHVEDGSVISLLSQAIGRGAWPHLRELGVIIGEGDEMVPNLMEAIGVGATELVSLRLNIEAVRPEIAMALARMLRDGGCPRLEELDLNWSEIGHDGLLELWRALEGGAPCNTTLRRLGLSFCGITSGGVRELMESMGRGALPHLECLDISDNWALGDEGIVILAEAMAGGILGSLQQVNLSELGMEETGASALFQAFRDHKPCPHLKKLSVGSNDIGDGGVVELAKAIEAGALQHLQELGVCEAGMGEEGFKSLVKAIVAQQPNPGCPRLEVLNGQSNKRIDEDGVVYLAEMMKLKGAMQHLQEINLNDINLGKEAVKSLFESLGESHVCPKLSKLCLGGSGERIHRWVVELKQILEATRGRNRHCCRVVIEWGEWRYQAIEE